MVTKEQYIIRLEKADIKYRPAGDIYGLERTVSHVCPKGHRWEEKPRRILRGSKCPSCYWWRNS